MKRSTVVAAVTAGSLAVAGMVAPAVTAANAAVTSGVEVAWKIDNSWTAGFQAAVTVTNRTGQPLSPWAVNLALSHQVTSIWDAQQTPVTGGYRVTGPNWSKDLANGASTTFGLVANKVGSSALAPTGCTVVGTTCTVTGAGVPSQTPTPTPSPTSATPTPTPTTASPTPTTASPTPTQSSASPTATPTSGTKSLKVVLKNSNDWGTGRTVDATVTNTGSTAATSWSVSMPWTGTTQLWNATGGTSGGKLTAANVSWNGSLASNAATSFGFNDTGNAMSNPTACTAVLNGATASCEVQVVGAASPTPTPTTSSPTPTPTSATPTPTPSSASPTPTPTQTSTSPSPSPTQSTPTATPTQTGTPTVPPSSPGAPTTPTGKKTVAYYTAWATYGRNYQVSQIPAAQLTHINYAFANVANGQCVLGDPYADTDKAFAGDSWDTGAKRGNFNQLTKLKAANPHLRTLISVGGWTWSANFSAAAATAASRDAFATSCVTFMKQWGFDGIDIDWEYPVSGGLQNGTPADKANYTLLLQALRSKLNAQGTADGGKHYDLTIAAPAGPSILTNLEIDKVAATLDWINLMTYDYHGSWDSKTGHNAPLYAPTGDPGPAKFDIDSTVNAYLAAGAPANKLVLGLAMYGRSFAGVTATNNGLFQSTSGAGTGTWEPGSLDYKDIAANYLPRLVRQWDASAKVPYLYDSAKKEFITYDDAESIKLKAEYIKSRNLAGGMFWELSGDTSDYALLDSLNGNM